MYQTMHIFNSLILSAWVEETVIGTTIMVLWKEKIGARDREGWKKFIRLIEEKQKKLVADLGKKKFGKLAPDSSVKGKW